MIKMRNLFVLLLLTVLSVVSISSIAAAAEQEAVATGQELVSWMEAHKTTGGTVTLTEDITLEDMWYFVPDRAGRPDLTVDTAGHSITVRGEISFLSDHHLTFRRPEGGKPVFHVKKRGLLSLEGTDIGEEKTDQAAAAEEGNDALVQDEGAGLLVTDCAVSGKICYAQTPFVRYNSPVTVVAEPGQTAADVIPQVIASQVIREGKVFYDENVPVSWELSGTEKLQQDRRRFTVRGSFPGAACITEPVCTVAYNDFPLTFTDVTAAHSLSLYLFKGGYTKPEGTMPIRVSSEYSFDNKNWIHYSIDTVTDRREPFFIGLTKEEWDVSVHPSVYIRLRCDHDGTEYYSNVLRYTADDLDRAVDQGGNRGGGTAVVDPPKEPAAVPDPVPSVPSQPTPLPASQATPLPTPGKSGAGSEAEGSSVSPSVTSRPTPTSIPDSGKSGAGSAVEGNSVSARQGGKRKHILDDSQTDGRTGSGAETPHHSTEEKSAKTKTAKTQALHPVQGMGQAETVERADAGKEAAGLPWIVAALVLLCGAAAAFLIWYRRRASSTAPI